MLNDEIIVQDNEAIPEESSDTQLGQTQDDIPTTEQEAVAEESEAELLRKELDTLRAELEEKNKTFERMSREIGEFSEIFPEKSVNSIPDSVWESVKAGIPLAAAYALYERKNTVRADTASRINERNGEISTGAVGRATTENFYTPDEVRAMSRTEVRKNYSKIIESMKKWN